MYFASVRDINNKYIRYYYLKNDKCYFIEYNDDGIKNEEVDYKETIKFYKNLLCNNNGILYERKDDDELFNKNKIKLTILKGTAVILLSIDLALLSSLTINTHQNIKDVKYLLNENSDYYVTDLEYELMDQLDISNSFVNEIINSKILDDVVPYYHRNQLLELMNEKLEGLNIDYYDSRVGKSSLDKKTDVTVMGYYNGLSPNTIHLQKGRDDIFYHEFIHMLQTNVNNTIIIEPMAELMAYEYFGNKLDCYYDEVINLKLLLLTIGKEPIMKLCFGNDDSDLIMTVTNNLPSFSSIRFLSYLNNGMGKKYDPLEFRSIILRLYENIYGTKLEESPYYDLITQNGVYQTTLDTSCYLRDDNTLSFIINENYLKTVLEDFDVITVINKDEYFRKKARFDEVPLLNYTNMVIEINDFELKAEDIFKDIQKAYADGHITVYKVLKKEQIKDFEGWGHDHYDKMVIVKRPKPEKMKKKLLKK